MAIGVSLSRIVVIESLAPEEVRTGQITAGWLSSLADEHNLGIGVDLVTISGAQGFRQFLRELTELSRQQDDWPMLHIECHGSKSIGLRFSDDTLLPWESFGLLLTELNIATQFNLPVVVSACFGAHLLSQYSPVKPAPAFGIIAPTHAIDPAEILSGLRTFYSRFAATSDLGLATSELAKQKLSTGGWFSKLAEHWYEQLAAAHLHKHCTRAAVRHWARTFSHKLRSAGRSTPVREIERQLMERSLAGLTGKYFDRFFCLHRIPDNAARFAPLRARVEGQIAALRDARL